LISNDGKDRGVDLFYFSSSEKQAFVGFDNSTSKMFAAVDVAIASEIVTVANYGNFCGCNLEGATVSHRQRNWQLLHW
jgi:hypothetical protein